MDPGKLNIKGLSNEQILKSRAEHGANTIDQKKENGFLEVVKSLAKEPMVVLLLIAATIYFISGNESDGIFLALAIVLVSVISLYQDSRSRKALVKPESI